MINRNKEFYKGVVEKMILLKDLNFLTDIAENKTSLYNMIAEELGLDENQQEKLVAELEYQFLYINDNVGNIKKYDAELEEENENLIAANNELEADYNEVIDENNYLEDKNYELREEIYRLQEENEELRKGIND